MKSIRGHFTLMALMAVAGTTTFADTADAALIHIASDESFSSNDVARYDGTIEYQYNAITSMGDLTISLSNTSPTVNAGRITAFVFNFESLDPAANATLVNSTYAAFENAPNQSAGPFGNPYDGGAAVAGHFLGGGSPAGGIGLGDTGVFQFQVAASDAALLSPLSFINGPFEFDFLVRFRGGSADVLPAIVVPGPASLCVIALALALPRRRRILPS